MTVQNVSCFSDTEFIPSDTCPQDKTFLKKLTKSAVERQVLGDTTYPNYDYGVSWYTLDKPDVCLNTSCHAYLDRKQPPEFLMNVIRWGVNPTSFSKEFALGFADWMLDSEKSLWKDAMHRVSILRDDSGKPLATLWLNPKDTPSVPLVHFCIGGPRFITEVSKRMTSAESVFGTCGDYLKSFVGGHVRYVDKSPRFVPAGHLSLDPGIKNGVSIPILNSSFPKEKDEQWSIFVNGYFSSEVIPWVKKPAKPTEYSDCWDETVAKYKEKSK